MNLLLMCLVLFSTDGPQLSLVLANGDDEQVLTTVLAFAQARRWTRSPTIIAMEPGPLEMQRGLRMLPNEIPPRLSTPRILVINHQAGLEFPMPFLAFLRRCLSEGTTLVICGNTFPEALAGASLLEPGQTIRLVAPADLAEVLAQLMPEEPALPQLPAYFLHWRIR